MWIKSTLANRVTRSISLLSILLFLIFSWATLVVAYIIEDKMIHNVLTLFSENLSSLPANMKVVNAEQLIAVGYITKDIDDVIRRVNSFGEFEATNDYYHFMILENQILLFNSTNMLVVSSRIEAIIRLLAIIFIPCLLLAIVLSRKIAVQALKPFSLLKNSFATSENKAVDIQNLNQQIKESDIKEIADSLAQALQEKESVLEQRIIFNQGISHELRTPIQIIQNAVELIGIKYPELVTEEVFNRLTKSTNRMLRTSEAMLWLFAVDKEVEPLDVNQSIAEIRCVIESIYKKHGFVLEIIERNKLSLDVPSEVFEFIAYNLVGNVIHHGAYENGVKPLKILIESEFISFVNPMNVMSSTHDDSSHFDLGLSLVQSLCDRFDLHLRIEQINSQFTISITK